MCLPLRLTETKCSPTSRGVKEIPVLPLGNFFKKHGSSHPDGDTRKRAKKNNNNFHENFREFDFTEKKEYNSYLYKH